MRFLWLAAILLLMSGDVEPNPGPRASRPSTSQKGPSVDEKIESLTATLAQYEAKVTGLESELEKQQQEAKENDAKIEQLTNEISSLKTQTGESLDDFSGKMAARLEEAEKNIVEVKANLAESDRSLAEGQSSIAQKLANVEDFLEEFKSSSDTQIRDINKENGSILENFNLIEERVKEIKADSIGKIQSLMMNTRDQRKEYKSKFVDLDVEFQRMKDRLEMLSIILDDMHEKMYEFEQTKKNNLIFYGVRNRSHETTDSLKVYMTQLFKDHLNIRREVPILRASRVYTGPEVKGTRPVLVTFETFKDRETVLRQSRALKKANVDVSEDLSKRTRESRQELRKFMRKIKRANPEKNCFLEYDRLYVDHKIFVYNEALEQVIELSEAERYGRGNTDPFYSMSRPGTQMMMLGEQLAGLTAGLAGGGHSRPASGMMISGRHTIDRPLKSASAVRLPPLNKNLSLSTGAVSQIEASNSEVNSVVQAYEEKLAHMTNDYREKVKILEDRLADKELVQPYTQSPTGGHQGQHEQQQQQQPMPNGHNEERTHPNVHYDDYDTDIDEEPVSPSHHGHRRESDIGHLGQNGHPGGIPVIPEEDTIPPIN